MKNLKFFFLTLFVTFAMAGCGGEESSDDGNITDDVEVIDDGDGASDISSNIAVSVWEGHSLRSEPGKGGKWLATISFGEEMAVIGDTVYDSKAKKAYANVELLDGKKGWARYDLVEYGGTLGAIKSENSLYSRPSVSNITDNKVEMAQLVVVVDKKDDNWTRIIGKNNKSGKRAKGWILGNDALTSNEIDIAVAVMLSKAMSESNPVKKKEKFQAILDNSSYSGTAFMGKVEELASEADPMENLKENELMVTGDVVNVRSSASIDEDNVVFQVKSGDVGTVLEKGIMDEIGGKTDYWYKIEVEGQQGWLFGSNTSRSLAQ